MRPSLTSASPWRRILALDASLARASAAVVIDGVVTAQRIEPGGRGQSALLAPIAAAVLAEAAHAAEALDAIAVTVGPGSFTGVRSALSLAHGIGLGMGKPVIGVTVGEALAEALPQLGGRHALDRHRQPTQPGVPGQGHGFSAVALDALPPAEGRIAVAGDAAIEVAGRLAARGDDVMLTDARLPWPRHVALVAERRLAGTLPPLAAQPLYIDPPEARLPAGGLRPEPA